ncbi:hypothetical protein [Xanthomonas translucens]|uniref:hypothetical protein n=1 Tax=Xanthomonas campestris pv. translucens TaxID=343 RepID=UPI0021B83845|nr:hypothetical protein [Xanthomonas translucens]MCT8275841.1 hypothetical protein [Xanthomonas translucens pv. translucens]MCT8278605.1 hypothetical protein [Xanthomonas translucens pv. translucens]WLA10137.1 hypothetical protein MO328_08580 [Xanthomonas translucens]WNJ27675.1 hypothetical protein RMA73_03275 [Xanthomonas translucens pv. translucens]
MSVIDLIEKISKASLALFGMVLGVSRKTVGRRLSFMAMAGIFSFVGTFLILKFMWYETDNRRSLRSSEQTWAIEDAQRFRAISAIDDCMEAKKRNDPEVKWYCDEAKERYTQVVWPTPQEREKEVVKREVYSAMRSDLLMQSRREEAFRKASRPELWEIIMESLGRIQLLMLVALMVMIPYLAAMAALYWVSDTGAKKD